eukprot:m.73490 g.73490  ORF g.73490 m.73490 type:complete len:431 (+) comp18812_c0_seq2:2082-3374(+)
MRASHLALGCAVATLCLVHTAADTPAGHGAVLVDTRGRGDKGAREAEFVAFKAKHSKTYGSADEHARRFDAYVAHVEETESLNALPHDHGHTAVYGPNRFADFLPHERHMLFSGVSESKPQTSAGNCSQEIACCNPCIPVGAAILKGPDPPSRLDWREYKTPAGISVVTPIVNQGHCGACWAFSAVASIETAWLMAGNEPVGGGAGSLSVQRVLDCVYPFISNRTTGYPDSPPQCSGGGLVEEALEYGLNYGVPAAATDTYKCGNGCADGKIGCSPPFPVARPNTSTPPAKNSKSWITQCCGRARDFMCGHSPNMRAIMRATATYGLLAINVNAHNWVGYTSGIIRNHCDPTQMNHAVILAGYGTDIVDGTPIDYWLIRNSWGTEWGEQGYGRLYRDNATNVCGFASEMWLASANRSDVVDGAIFIDECY